MEKGILDILAENFLNEKMESIMKQDKGYMELDRQINEQGEKFESMDMDAEKRQAAEQLISLHINSIDFYAKASYKQGMKDWFSLLEETGLIEMLKFDKEKQ